MSHEAIAASFDAWLEDDSTHWVGDQDAAYQAWLYVHENAVAGLEDEVSRLRAEIAGLRTGYEAFEHVNAGLKAECEGLRAKLTDCSDSLHSEMLGKFGGQMPDDMHPVTRREYDRDMAEVAGYRADLEKGAGQ